MVALDVQFVAHSDGSLGACCDAKAATLAQVHVTIIDIYLIDDEIDGIEVLRQIKEMAPQAVCTMVSRLSDQHIIEKAGEYGADNYILKPLSLEEMATVIKESEERINNHG